MSVAGKRAVVLAEKDYEDNELWYPLLRLRGAGIQVRVVGTGSASTYASKHGQLVSVDVSAEGVKVSEVDAVVVPGGYAPDRLRRYPAVLNLVKDAFEQGKIVAAICHAGWVLSSAGILKGRTVTSVSAIKDDMVNAGANWVDKEVVVDGNLITSRQPADLPAFTDAILSALGASDAGNLDGVTATTSPLEAFRIAVQTEESSQRFYMMASQKTNDAEAKNIFHQLAREEERHRAFVLDEYNRLNMNPEWDRYRIWREVM